MEATLSSLIQKMITLSLSGSFILRKAHPARKIIFSPKAGARLLTGIASLEIAYFSAEFPSEKRFSILDCPTL
ncbi:hypothetical protein CHM34_01895 [Paludifilum halophilum]|uniref:Uncharacterized protein n=1 Tax=Paludifilum halophilum TaxID=1642702 RepID=A0A235BBU3_9BACL|nr:hypothetical protein CHM34_01895 [Paludifilum halophilum]